MVDLPRLNRHEARVYPVSFVARRAPACTASRGTGFASAIHVAHQFAELDCQQDQQEHVQRVYSDDYFFGGGAGYNDYLSEERLLVARGRWYAKLMSRYCQPGAVLDIGAASGFTLQGLREAGWQGFGIEPNVGLAEYATNRFGIPVEACSLESWTTCRRYDLVTMLQVLPHFLDPKKAIRKSANLLPPGGHLLIESWDRRSWTARLFGKNWHEYSPPSVLHWFSRDGIVRLAANLGFEFVAQGRPSKWIGAGHAKSLLASKASFAYQPSVAGWLRSFPIGSRFPIRRKISSGSCCGVYSRRAIPARPLLQPPTSEPCDD